MSATNYILRYYSLDLIPSDLAGTGEVAHVTKMLLLLKGLRP